VRARPSRTRAALVLALALATSACSWIGREFPPPPGHGHTFRATGFFHTAFDGDRWWLVTPDGRPFYSTGVNHVSASPDTDRKTGICPYCEAVATKYPNVDAWRNGAVDRLRSWGFNTIGAWSDTDRFAARMPYTVLLDMAGGGDWFSPDFEARAASIAASAVVSRRDDPNLVGWLLDNELHWGPDWRMQHPLLDDYLTLPPGSPGRAVADHYVGNPNGFLRALAARYFRVTTVAIRAQDPHHLILGVRMIAQLAPREVIEAARPYVDVFSVNHYTLLPGLDEAIQRAWGPYVPVDPTLSAFHEISDLPIMVTEYSFRAADSGVPNSWPPIFPTLATQQDRANAYAASVQRLYSAPWIVGDHWFEYADEPPGGRFDGEDSNFGLVSNRDVPWQTLVDRMTRVHAMAPDRLADRRLPCGSWERTGPDDHVRCVERAPRPEH